VKAEDPIACVTVKCKVCKSAIRCITCSPELCVNKVSINLVIQSKTPSIVTPTRDHIMD
jgi:hypothetical protein